MSLYILGLVLMIVGLYLSAHERRDTYRDTWALILLICGFLLIVVRLVSSIWRLL